MLLRKRETEMKPMLCKNLTQQCIDRNEWYKLFVRWNLFIGGKEELSGTTWTTIYDLLWNATSINNEQFQSSIRSISTIECQCFRIKNCLKRKNVFFFTRNQTTVVELRKTSNWWKNHIQRKNQTNLSTKTKISNKQD